MRLRTRLTVALVTVTTLGTLMLGGVAISEVRRSRIDALDHAMEAVASQVRATPTDPLAAALFAVDQSPTSMALGFTADGAPVAWLRDLADMTVPTPSAEEQARAVGSAIDLGNGFRALSVHLEDGATLVVVASLAEIDDLAGNELIFLATFWLALSIIMGVLVRLLVRRDVREIEHLVALASAIAGGAQEVGIPASGRATEVDELATALRRMVDSLRGSLLAERGANQRMQEFLGDASHELRTPLTVIKGYLELLERDVEPEQRERALQRMRAETHRMDLLVNDLLLLAEIGTPAADRLEHIDLADLVRVMVEDLRELQPERAIEADMAARVVITAVPSHVHRAVANAMANIRRHTAAGDPVRVHLGLQQGTALLVIEDGGPGLSDEMYSRGIAHFQRFDRSRSRATGGSGLGMSMIAAVMDEVGGHVSIGPSELGGLRIEYEFPLAN